MSYEMPDQIFAALADRNRRALFEEISRAPTAVARLADKFPISRPAVSQHLRILSDAGLVTVRPEGTRRIYAANPERLEVVRAWLDRYWGSVLGRFAEEIDRMHGGSG